jgi:hypothetical protein
MSDFKPKSKKLSFNTIPESDQGIAVSDALVLLNDSEYRESILLALGIEEIAEDIIAIPGAASLVKSVLETDAEFEKFDLKRRYENLTFVRPHADDDYHEKDVLIEFDAKEEGRGTILASPAYTAQPDLLEKTGSMRSYAKNLIENGRIDMVFHDLEQVRTIYNANSEEPHEHSYRIVKDLENGEHYYRAITSTTHYKDYNIKLSVFVFLVAIHRLMQATGDEYILNRAEHTDSRIKAFFEKIGKLHQSPLGKVKFLIELRNNEVKEGSVKFSGVCAIVYEDKEPGAVPSTTAPVVEFEKYEDEYGDEEQINPGQTQDIYLTPRPNKLKYKIESIKHNVSPGKAMPRMMVAEKVKEVEELLYADLSMAADADTLEKIRLIIKSKIKALPASSFLGAYKGQLNTSVPETLENVEELLRMVGKLNLIVPNQNANAKDYLRYMFFEAIVERGRPGFSKTDPTEEAE